MRMQMRIFAGAIALLAISVSCTESTKEEGVGDDKSVLIESLSAFAAVDMPSQLANGDNFPTDSNTINGWLAVQTIVDGVETDPNVIGHTWGLWQALTEETDQNFNGRNLLRYETWYTPQDVMRASKENVSLDKLKRTDGLLQFRKKFKFGHDENLNPVAGDISGKVKYSPSMARRALKENYFDTTMLQSMIKEGEINSVNFKNNDVMLKPVYRVLTDMNKVSGKDDTYYFSIWGGKQDGGKSLDDFSKKVQVTTDLSNPNIDDKTLYGISSFIHHEMTAAEAYTYNHSSKEGQQFQDTAHAGDPVILLGMHCSTRETRRWTWQTFYWTESPDSPVFPSSSTIAAGRKDLNIKLGSPANHYAASIAYSMMSPALPYEGPAVDIMSAGVVPVYGLNPYIEGTFDASVFPNQAKYFSGDFEKQFYPGNVDGITSNCMGCHSQSYYTLNGFEDNFLPDQYVQRNAPWFKGSVQLDFAWSLFPGFEPPPFDYSANK